ncbi:MAG: ABC transporter ATP-binding protein, partial [bacterium]
KTKKKINSNNFSFGRETLMRNIRVESVSKTYADEMVLDKLNLEIPSGQFFALLGPSGCGKTTLLRLIAGLEEVDAGKIYLGNQDITHQPIYKRKINTVFQQYALFPHLNVFENVAYSLRAKGKKTKDLKDRVFDMLRSFELSGHEWKYPRNLSGGQQQRVALARAIINEPDVLLLDEPLAALDQRLKEQVLIELIDLQDKLKTTFIYVTHDQFEALTVATRMAIMNDQGRIEQIGTPKEIYEFPHSKFVATFVGSTNLIEGTLHKDDGKQVVEVDGLGFFSVYSSVDKPWMIPGSRVLMSLRPEKIDISKKNMEQFSNCLQGVVEDIIYYGRSTQYRVGLKNGKKLLVFEQNEEHFPQETIDYNENVFLYFQKENVVLLEY